MGLCIVEADPHMTNDEIIDRILTEEGGYVNDPVDPGGATNFGITQATLSEVRGHPADAVEVAALTEADARAIYLQRYIVEPGFDNVLDGKLRWLLVDCAVNNGRGRAVRWLQNAIGVKADGVLGPQTIGRLAIAPSPYYKVCAERVRAYARLVVQNHPLVKFLAGWMNRAAMFIEA